jgi:sulfhydrogenase subunit delta
VSIVKPRVGIFGLSGCWGEQIVILNCEDELLAIAGEVEFVDFLGASSVNDTTGPLDIAFVEGSVGSAREEAALRRIRERATLLVACGSCACFGGVAAAWDEHFGPEALRGDSGVAAQGLVQTGSARYAVATEIYGDAAAVYDMRPHRPLHDFVRVDASLPGCPMEKEEFLQAVACLLNGDTPQPVAYPVCAECRMNEQECLLLAYGIHCSGPVTAGGCGARCPGFNAPCIGCRGPAEEANLASMETIVRKAGYTLEDFRRRQRLFAAPAAAAEEGLRK